MTFFSNTIKSSAVVFLKQAVLAHCMGFQFGPFIKLLPAVYPSLFPEPLQREESFVLERW